MVELVLRVVLSLAVVLGLLWLIARVSSRRLRGSSHQGLVRTLVRQPLSRGTSLAVVSVGERVLVVGVTEHQVNLLTELDPAETLSGDADPGASASGPSVASVATSAARTSEDGPAVTAAGSEGLGGSILSGQTWKQAFAAATRRHGNGS